MTFQIQVIGPPFENPEMIADQGPTTLDNDYVDSPKKSCGGPLLAALTNTFAHEYTHYNSRYISYDNHVVIDRTYVSHGI